MATFLASAEARAVVRTAYYSRVGRPAYPLPTVRAAFAGLWASAYPAHVHFIDIHAWLESSSHCRNIHGGGVGQGALGSYNRKLWMRLRRKAAYLPG